MNNSKKENQLFFTEKEKDEVLENFMKEHFDFNGLVKAGIFTKEIKKDYKAQDEKICHFLGLKTVFEYGSEEIRCHISYPKGKRPPDEKFITVIPNIYE